MFTLKCKAFDSRTDSAGAEAAVSRRPALGSGFPAGPGAGVAGRPAGPAPAGAAQQHLVGARNPSPRGKQTPPPRDRAGIFQRGRRLLKGPLSAGRRPARGQGDSDALGVGGTMPMHPSATPQITCAGFSERPGAPIPPRGEYCLQGGWEVRPRTPQDLCLGLPCFRTQGSFRPWELCVFVAPSP